MNEIAEKLMRLCNPDAEAMSDFDRINAFVHVGIDAAQEITRLENENVGLRYALDKCEPK